MTLFEYITVASSILLSFAAVRLLDTIPHAFAAPQRDPLHCAYVIAATWGCAQFWWVAWSFSAKAHWTSLDFLLYLAAPALIYSLARTLSSPDPSRVESFRDHFDRVHVRFFGLLATYLALLVILTWVVQGVPLLHPLRLYQLPGIVAAASGALVANRRYHALLAVLFLANLAAGTVVVFTEPGGGLPTSP